MTTKKKSRTKAAPAAATSAEPKPVVLTVTIFPLKNGKRPLVISGAPDGEMPVVRTGNFSEIHRLFDELWLEMIKRKPKVVARPTASKSTERTSKASGEDKDEAPESGEADTETTDEAQETSAEETGEASPEAVAELEQSIFQAKSNVEEAADQLVHSVGGSETETHEQLPLIEGDPTAG